MNKSLKNALLLIFFFFGCLTVFSQNKKQPLALVLDLIEQQFKVSFSYADSTIKDLDVFFDGEKKLDIIITSLEQQTQLKFNKLNKQFITIVNPEADAFAIQELEEVFISNYLTTGINKKLTGSITIKPEQFGILPGLIEPDVLQTIQALPGVISVDETVSNINIRGGTHDQNLILWEDIKMYQSGHFFGLISAFNPYLTNKVNVSKNGTSAQYGDGVSSVIDMQLSNTIQSDFKAGAGFNLVHADMYTKTPIGKHAELQLSARRSFTDFVTAPTYKQYFKRIFQDSDLDNNQEIENNTISKNEKFYFYDFTGKFLLNISKKDKLQIRFLTIHNNLDYEEQSTINNINESLNSNLTQRNMAGGISYSRNWNSKLASTAQVYFSKYNLDAKNFDIINNQRLIQENKVFDSAIKLDTKWRINENANFQIGYQFFEVGISNLEDVNNPEFRSYIKEVIRSHATFTEAQLVSNNLNTNVKAGIRFNYFPKLDTFLAEPRISFSQRFANYFRLELLGEFKSQTTSQIIDLQNDFLGIEKRRWVLANNTDIPIIKSKQASLGINYNKNKFLISIEAYYKKADGITTRSQGFQNQFQYIKAIGSYQVKGVDFLIHKQFTKFNTWLSYSYSKNDYTFESLNNANAFPNNADITHAVNFSNTYTQNKFKFALGVNWHSGKPYTKPDKTITSSNINYNSPNSSNLKDYLRVDFSATKDFKISEGINAEIGASVWNLLNTKNTINRYYVLDTDENISKVENQSLGITPNLSLRVYF
ncbi:TonB-dependent siderophore receptor [Oceanihabitans sp. 2_MG-2023]|uniref:TonB-dependent receptor plug domain-containing protein n=1 Tax=Oceanihabitans sp. 2_MG-2023 TaxID=3062661 RepID=UPI0026E1A978|nr:TonB-dependent receptor [Oceanihabitans sp. 2_MG-2023]